MSIVLDCILLMMLGYSSCWRTRTSRAFQAAVKSRSKSGSKFPSKASRKLAQRSSKASKRGMPRHEKLRMPEALLSGDTNEDCRYLPARGLPTMRLWTCSSPCCIIRCSFQTPTCCPVYVPSGAIELTLGCLTSHRQLISKIRNSFSFRTSPYSVALHVHGPHFLPRAHVVW